MAKKKKGKKKGKGGKGRAPKAGERDAAAAMAAAAEAEQNVAQDASSSTDAAPSGPILPDGVLGLHVPVVDEDALRQQDAEGLNKVHDNEALVDEADADAKINAEAYGANDKTQDVSTPPAHKKSDDDVSTVMANNEAERKQESAVTNLADAKTSADDVVPTKQEKEEVGTGAVPIPGLPLTSSAGTEPDIEPTLTTSLGSNSIGDEFNSGTASSSGAISNAPVVPSDQQRRQAQYQSASNDTNNDADSESESASQVMSDFTIGNFSTTSADSAIVALASVSRDEAARNSTISPLPMVARGLSSEETKALPPLDTSVDHSPDVSLAGDDGDHGEESEEVGVAGVTGTTDVNKTNSEDEVSDEAEEELDREIDTSLLAVAGQPSPRHAMVRPAESSDSTNVEIGINNEGEVDIASDGSDKDNEKGSTNKAVVKTVAAVGLATAGAVAIANSDGTVPSASMQDAVSDSPAVGLAEDVAPGSSDENNSGKAGEDTKATHEEGQYGIEGVTASDNGAENIMFPSNDEDNPSASFASNEVSREENSKERTSSVLAAGAAGAAAAGAAAIVGDVPSAEGQTANGDSETPVGAFDGDTNVDGAVTTCNEGLIAGTADEEAGESTAVQIGGDDERVEANDNRGKGAVAAAVAGATAVGAVAAGVAATSPDAPPSVAAPTPTEAENEASDDGELLSGMTTSPESSTRVEKDEIKDEEQHDSEGNVAPAIGATAVGAAMAGASAGAAAAVAPTNEAVPPSTPCETENFDGTAEIGINKTEPNPSAEEASFDDAVGPGRYSSKDSSEGEFYQHDTFSEEEDSSDGSRASTKDEREKGLVAAAAVGAAIGIAGAGAGTPVDSAPSEDVTAAHTAPEVTPEHPDFGKAKSSEDDTTCIDITPVTTEDTQQKDLEALDEYHKHRQSAVSPTSTAGSTNANGRDKKKGDKKKCMLIAAGALVLIGGIVGLVLALTLGRQDSTGAPVLPDETLRPTALPTPEVPNPSIPVVAPTTVPVGEGTSAPTKGSIDGTSQPTDALLVTSQPTSLPTRLPDSPTSAPIATTAAPTLVPTEQRPTSSPTTLAFAETFEDLQGYLVEFVPDPAALEDPDSPQYAAVTWLASDLAEKGVNRRLQQLEVVEAVVVQQRYALATLYFATEGDNWTDPSYIEGDPWLSSSNVCSWKGVICSPVVTPRIRSTTPRQGSATPHRANPSLRGRRVQEEQGPDEDNEGLDFSNLIEEEDITASTTTSNPTSQGPTPAPIVSSQEPKLIVTGLELEERNLSGPLPADIVILSGLKYFAASDNAITSIPSEIRALKGLERLYLDNNAIVRLSRSLARLPNLIDLSLHGNMMTGTIPSSLGNLSSLRSLTLHNNALTGTMPEFVCVLRYNGEDDVLAYLTADCASSGNDPPKVECSCCTECYPFTTLSDLNADAPTTLTPSLSPTVATVDLSESPTISSLTKDNTSASPTVSEETATASDPLPVPGGDVADDTVMPDGDEEAPPTTGMTERPKEAKDEALESTTVSDTVIIETPAQAPAESTEGEEDGADTNNDEVQNERDKRDSNDWYLLIYGDPREDEKEDEAEDKGAK